MYKIQCVQAHTFAWNFEVAVLYQSVKIKVVLLSHIIYIQDKIAIRVMTGFTCSDYSANDGTGYSG